MIIGRLLPSFKDLYFTGLFVLLFSYIFHITSYKENGMENNNFSSRTNRDEFRGRYNTEKSPVKKTKADAFVRLTVLQSIICAVVVAIVAAACRISPAANEKLRGDYSQLMSRNMSVAQVIEQLGGIVKEAFSTYEGADTESVSTLSPAVYDSFYPVAESATDAEEYSEEYFSASGNETGEAVAVGKIIGGGVDLEKGEAIKGTSFESYSISASVYAPVAQARVTSPFGYRTNPVSGKYGFHTGIDLAADEGTPVSAAFYGRVKECGEDDVWGRYVLLEHSDNCETYYCHLSEIYVTEDAVIRQGETIGLVGSTGWSTGPHLHFEVRIDGIRVDPARILYPDEN